MASHEHGHLWVCGQGVDLAEALAVDHELVGEGRQAQLGRGVGIAVEQGGHEAAGAAVELVPPRHARL